MWLVTTIRNTKTGGLQSFKDTRKDAPHFHPTAAAQSIIRKLNSPLNRTGSSSSSLFAPPASTRRGRSFDSTAFPPFPYHTVTCGKSLEG
mmetsp:Transcript_60665/g.179910  ORF Transcript_60665/g.179910 Transcript_60665/m.179910 type:complete len:90 (-) Transcript_60665:757-1026(-)